MTSPTAPQKVRLRPIAIPIEHGGWGFLFEPIVLGLVLGWSLQGVSLALAAVGAFLVRQPLKVLWSDFAARRDLGRTRIAVAFAGGYGLLALAGFGFAFYRSPGAALPLLLSLPLVAILLWYDARGRSRDPVPELLAPIALAAVGGSIVMLDGWGLPGAAAIWSLLSLRAVPSVLYVRARLRLEYGRDPELLYPLVSHAAALVAVLWLSRIGLVPVTVAFLFALLLLRCWAALSPLRRRLAAKAVGFSEVRWGLIAIAWIALAYQLAPLHR